MAVMPKTTTTIKLSKINPVKIKAEKETDEYRQTLIPSQLDEITIALPERLPIKNTTTKTTEIQSETGIEIASITPKTTTPIRTIKLKKLRKRQNHSSQKTSTFIIGSALSSTITSNTRVDATMSLIARKNHTTSVLNESAEQFNNNDSNYTHNIIGNGNDSNEFITISTADTIDHDASKNILAATITSIRKNVTRVLDLYFQNVTDEYGYGAATTTTSTTTTTTTTPLTPIITLSSINNNDDDNNDNLSRLTTSHETTTTTATPTLSSSMDAVVNATKELSDNLKNSINSTASTLHTHLTNLTSPPLRSSSVTEAMVNRLAAANATTASSRVGIQTTAPSITYPSFSLAVRNQENCTALFSNYMLPQSGTFCNWTWDQFLCWPPTPAGALARMNCPSGWHGIDTKKFAIRKCEFDGHWGGRPNETYSANGWTDYQPCFKPEVNELLQQMKNLDLFLDIAKRTRTLEIVGLVLSLFALLLSLLIFCNFRSLRNNRTKIHTNLFIAMVLQVIVRLTLYLDQAFRRGKQEAATNTSLPGIENTPYLCEASYILLEYARTAMFMWMFIEGLYLHNMVTVAVFQGRFPHTVFSLLGWGLPVVMTTVWALCTAAYTDSEHDCWWNYNLTPYYWILEGPRLVVILLNFFFLMNIIRVLVVKLRQSQASDIEQTRKAVRAAIVLLPLLGITNLLHLVPALNTPWKFALWSYVTHFLTSFQGFFIALIYCFLNGEVRAVLLKSLAVYMSVHGHPEWVPKRASMFSGAYNTAPETEGQPQQDDRRDETPPNSRWYNRKSSNATGAHTQVHAHVQSNSKSRNHVTTRLSNNDVDDGRQEQNFGYTNNNIGNGRYNNRNRNRNSNWIITLCFRGQKVLRVPPASSVPPESVVFELSEQ